MITDRIGQHKVLLPINHNYDVTFRAFLNKNTRNSFFAGSEKKMRVCDGAYCPIA